MGVIDGFLEKFGFMRIDKQDAEIVEATEEDQEAIGKVIQLPVSKKVELKTTLKLTERQETALLNPFRDGMMPPRECFENEKLASGFQLVKNLMIVPADNGEGMVWTTIIAAFAPGRKGRRSIKPHGALKGIMISRAQGALKGVGDLGDELGEWKDKGKQYVMWRRLSFSEEQEFKRLHGDKWYADAINDVPKDGILNWSKGKTE